jgi:Kef-type K+ transport system membrane component KefB
MQEINAYIYILAACLLVICSYFFNLFSNKTGIPAVLLLLVSGIVVRELMLYNNLAVNVPVKAVEICGILGLIMIVMEAGLDLRLGLEKVSLIRRSFFSSLVILAVSVAAYSGILYFYLRENLIHCLVYALPLSVVSSAIVIPSIAHLETTKKEFLVYETSFSDILGILFFNYIISGNILQTGNIIFFVLSIIFTLILSVAISILLLFILTRITTKVRFFLVFAVLILLYVGGKMLNLPALVIILFFGLVVANWKLSLFQRFYNWLHPDEVDKVSHLLHALTQESSFLIRTFFFFIFGLTINVKLLTNPDVILTGSLIVLALLVVRYVYLRFFLRGHIFPELFFMPRGLITILLFYSIPVAYKLNRFNEGILFFVIILTSVIMMIGSITYGKPELQSINDDVPYDEKEE